MKPRIGKKPRFFACEAVAIDPNAAHAFFALGLALEKQGADAGALDALHEGLAIEDRPDVRVIVARLYRRLGRTELACREFEDALERGSNDTEALFGLALTVRNIDPDRAERLLRRALELDANESAVHRELGYVLWRRGNLSDAEEALHRAMVLAPEDPWVYDYLGTILVDTKRYAEAQQAFSRAIELYPGEALFHAELGDVLSRQGRDADAEQAYLAGLAKNVSSFAANLHFAKFLEDRGYLSRAVQYYERASIARPTSLQVKDALARLRKG